MKRCILHVGMHKTGSTSIQSSLSGFSDACFVYHESTKGESNQTRAMFALLGVGGGGPRERAKGDPAAAGEVLRRLDESAQSLGDRQLLISAEGLWLVPAKAVGELARILAARFDAVRVAGYVRPPAAFMSSYFQQRVKGGSRRSGGVDVEREYPHYRRAFEKFDDAFGRENVSLWKFDPGAFPGGCVVQDFCARLGIDLPSERIVRVNESLPRETVALLYTYWALGEELGAWPMARIAKHDLWRQLMALGSARFRFSPEVIRPVLEKNRADIEWMEARLGLSLQEDLGEHQPGDVLEEADLLEPDAAAVQRLLALLGTAAPRGIRGETPREVAQLVHALREKRLVRSA
jgi:hypothetical protein